MCPKDCLASLLSGHYFGLGDMESGDFIAVSVFNVMFDIGDLDVGFRVKATEVLNSELAQSCCCEERGSEACEYCGIQWLCKVELRSDCDYVLYEQGLSLGDLQSFWGRLSGSLEQGLDVQIIYIPCYVIYPVPGMYTLYIIGDCVPGVGTCQVHDETG